MMMTGIDLCAHRDGDDVAVAVRSVEPGQKVLAFVDSGRREEISVAQAVPLGHKVALRDIPEGTELVEYGMRIGITSQPISAGEHVHSHNLASQRWR